MKYISCARLFKKENVLSLSKNGWITQTTLSSPEDNGAKLIDSGELYKVWEFSDGSLITQTTDMNGESFFITEPVQGEEDF